MHFPKRVDHVDAPTTNALASAWRDEATIESFIREDDDDYDSDGVYCFESLQKYTPPKYEWEAIYCDDCKKTQFILHDARAPNEFVNVHHWRVFNDMFSLGVSVLPDGCECDVAAAAAATTIQRAVLKFLYRRIRRKRRALKKQTEELKKQTEELKKQNEELKKRKRASENVENGNNKRVRLPELRIQVPK